MIILLYLLSLRPMKLSDYNVRMSVEPQCAYRFRR